GSALANMLGRDGPGQMVMDGIRPDRSASPEHAALRLVNADTGELRITLPSTERDHPHEGSGTSVTFRGPRGRILELSDPLTTVAGQAATALRRIELADSVRSHERQRYFRTLVQQSKDVILICRDGIIAYATPSAMELFGHDVVGQRYEDVVLPDRESR